MHASTGTNNTITLCRLLANLYSGHVYVWSTADQVCENEGSPRVMLLYGDQDILPLCDFGRIASWTDHHCNDLQSLVKSFEVTELPGEARNCQKQMSCAFKVLLWDGLPLLLSITLSSFSGFA